MAESQSGADDRGFTIRTGHEPPDTHAADRPEQVAQAWEALLQIRRLVQPDHPNLPAPWERAQPLRAVALGLEAAEVSFAAMDGQVVVGSGVQLDMDEGGLVRVTWRYRRGHRAVDAGEAAVPVRAAPIPFGRTWQALRTGNAGCDGDPTAALPEQPTARRAALVPHTRRAGWSVLFSCGGGSRWPRGCGLRRR